MPVGHDHDQFSHRCHGPAMPLLLNGSRRVFSFKLPVSSPVLRTGSVSGRCNALEEDRTPTNSNGEVTFTTIYPGWYQGRATHTHAEVTINGVSRKVTQIAFP